MTDEGGPIATRALPLYRRLLLLLLRPGRLFIMLREEPVWKDALGWQVLLSALLSIATALDTLPDAFEFGSMAVAASLATLGITAGLALLVAVLMVPLFYASVAALLFIGARLVMRCAVSFSAIFSATVHAAYVLLLGRIITSFPPLSGASPLSPPQFGLRQPVPDASLAPALVAGVVEAAFFALLGVALCRVCGGRRVAMAAGLGIALYLATIALTFMFRI